MYMHLYANVLGAKPNTTFHKLGPSSWCCFYKAPKIKSRNTKETAKAAVEDKNWFNFLTVAQLPIPFALTQLLGSLLWRYFLLYQDKITHKPCGVYNSYVLLICTVMSWDIIFGWRFYVHCSGVFSQRVCTGQTSSSQMWKNKTPWYLEMEWPTILLSCLWYFLSGFFLFGFFF